MARKKAIHVFNRYIDAIKKTSEKNSSQPKSTRKPRQKHYRRVNNVDNARIIYNKVPVTTTYRSKAMISEPDLEQFIKSHPGKSADDILKAFQAHKQLRTMIGDNRKSDLSRSLPVEAPVTTKDQLDSVLDEIDRLNDNIDQVGRLAVVRAQLKALVSVLKPHVAIQVAQNVNLNDISTMTDAINKIRAAMTTNPEYFVTHEEPKVSKLPVNSELNSYASSVEKQFKKMPEDNYDDLIDMLAENGINKSDFFRFIGKTWKVYGHDDRLPDFISAGGKHT